jgi:hypothetical protein
MAKSSTVPSFVAVILIISLVTAHVFVVILLLSQRPVLIEVLRRAPMVCSKSLCISLSGVSPINGHMDEEVV